MINQIIVIFLAIACIMILNHDTTVNDVVNLKTYLNQDIK